MESESLIALAETNNLPKFQFMDETTHRWILQNNPEHSTDDKLPNVQAHVSWLCKQSIPREWFLEPCLIDSIHGLRHLYRTAYFCLLLIGNMQHSDIYTKCATIAGLLHDIRRLEDKEDKFHAARTADWFRQHLTEITSHFNLTLTAENIASIETAIALHEIPYEEFTQQQISQYQEHTMLVDLLKTADALDRYRLPKLKWWINDRYLHLTPSHAVKQIAYNITALSEGNFLRMNNSQESVLCAIRHLQLRHDPFNSDWHNTHIFYGTYSRGL